MGKSPRITPSTRGGGYQAPPPTNRAAAAGSSSQSAARGPTPSRQQQQQQQQQQRWHQEIQPHEITFVPALRPAAAAPPPSTPAHHLPPAALPPPTSTPPEQQQPQHAQLLAGAPPPSRSPSGGQAAERGRAVARHALRALQRQRACLQHERSSLTALLHEQQRAGAEMRAGLEKVLRHAASVQHVEGMRHAHALAETRDAASRAAAQQQAEHAAALARCQEERGEAMLRADQLAAENARLVQMVSALKRHDDELYAGQQGSVAELRQLRASLASAEERIATTRMALEDESTRRLEAERRLTMSQAERPGLIAQVEGRAELAAELAALQATSSAALLQYKEDNAVLVSEVKRLKAELSASKAQVAMLESAGASTAEQLEARRQQSELEARSALAAATDDASTAQREAEKLRRQMHEAQSALRTITLELKEAAANGDGADEEAHGAGAGAGAGASSSSGAPVAAAEGGGSPEAASDTSSLAGDTASLVSRKSAVAPSTAGEALKAILAQRARLRTGLKAAAEQVMQAQRKLSRASARNTQLTSQLAEASEKAEAALANARSAESLRLRDEHSLQAEQKESARLRAELEDHRRILASTNAQLTTLPLGTLPTPRTMGPRTTAGRPLGALAAGSPVSGVDLPPPLYPSEHGDGDADGDAEAAEIAAGGGGASAEEVAEAVAEATRELAAALAEALTDSALESTRLEVATTEMASLEAELAEARSELHGTMGVERGLLQAGGRGRVVEHDPRSAAARAQARVRAVRQARRGETFTRKRATFERMGRDGGDAEDEGEEEEGEDGGDAGGGGEEGRQLGGSPSSAASGPSSAADVGRDFGRVRAPSGWYQRVAHEEKVQAQRQAEEQSRQMESQAERQKRAREYSERVRSLTKRGGGGGGKPGGRKEEEEEEEAERMAPSSSLRGRRVTAQEAELQATAQQAAQAAMEALERVAAEKEAKVQAERAAERAAGRAREREAAAAKLAEELEETQQALERSENEKSRLKTSLDESKRQLSQAFASADGAKRLALKEEGRLKELATANDALRFEKDRLTAALAEADDELQSARAAALNLESRLAENAAGEAIAREMGESSAAKAAEALGKLHSLEEAKAALQAQLDAATAEAEDLRVGLARGADEHRAFALLEAQCDSAQRAAFEAEQRANAEASSREQGYVEVLAIGATFAVEIATMDAQIERFGRTIAGMTFEHERLRVRCASLERQLADAEERIAIAEREADEGALSWRRKLVEEREKQAAAIGAEKAEGRRQLKFKLRQLQQELRAEMTTLSSMEQGSGFGGGPAGLGGPDLHARLEGATGGGKGGTAAALLAMGLPHLERERRQPTRVPDADPDFGAPAPLDYSGGVKPRWGGGGGGGGGGGRGRGGRVPYDAEEDDPAYALGMEDELHAGSEGGGPTPPGGGALDEGRYDELYDAGERDKASPTWEAALEAAAAQHAEASGFDEGSATGEEPPAAHAALHEAAEETAEALERKLRAIQLAEARNAMREAKAYGLLPPDDDDDDGAE